MMRQIKLQGQLQTAGYDASKEFRALAGKIAKQAATVENAWKEQQLSALINKIDAEDNAQIGVNGFSKSYKKFLKEAAEILDVKKVELQKQFSGIYDEALNELKATIEAKETPQAKLEIPKKDPVLKSSSISSDGKLIIEFYEDEHQNQTCVIKEKYPELFTENKVDYKIGKESGAKVSAELGYIKYEFDIMNDNQPKDVGEAILEGFDNLRSYAREVVKEKNQKKFPNLNDSETKFVQDAVNKRYNSNITLTPNAEFFTESGTVEIPITSPEANPFQKIAQDIFNTQKSSFPTAEGIGNRIANPNSIPAQELEEMKERHKVLMANEGIIRDIRASLDTENFDFAKWVQDNFNKNDEARQTVLKIIIGSDDKGRSNRLLDEMIKYTTNEDLKEFITTERKKEADISTPFIPDYAKTSIDIGHVDYSESAFNNIFQTTYLNLDGSAQQRNLFLELAGGTIEKEKFIKLAKQALNGTSSAGVSEEKLSGLAYKIINKELTDNNLKKRFQEAYIYNEVNGITQPKYLIDSVSSDLTPVEKTLFKKLIDVADGTKDEKTQIDEISPKERNALIKIGKDMLSSNVKSANDIDLELFAKATYGSYYSPEKLTELQNKLNKK
ncbi:MAG TPA: hypothetical protein DIV86_00145 [Alphaproteobacteria bacterium]|nr:hypothetical protein [Alphaproteobacteria bacterium]